MIHMMRVACFYVNKVVPGLMTDLKSVSQTNLELVWIS